eukprot:9361129-Pyramimonas_sp.AAC.1
MCIRDSLGVAQVLPNASKTEQLITPKPKLGVTLGRTQKSQDRGGTNPRRPPPRAHGSRGHHALDLTRREPQNFTAPGPDRQNSGLVQTADPTNQLRE